MRRTCEATVYAHESGGYSICYVPWMNSPSGGVVCGKPAVDYRTQDGRAIWYCVDHWDRQYNGVHRQEW